MFQLFRLKCKLARMLFDMGLAEAYIIDYKRKKVWIRVKGLGGDC